MARLGEGAAAAYFAKWYDHIAQTTGANYYANDTPRYATFTHPGLTNSDVDRYGNLTMDKLLNITDDAFCFITDSSPSRNFMDWHRLMQDKLIFSASTKVHCSRSVNDVNLAMWPLDVKLTFGGMGTTSLIWYTQFFIPGHSEPVFTRHFKYVYIDLITRKPTPLPKWFRTAYQGHEDTSIPDCRVDKFPRPSNTFVCRLMVVNSETDSNDHATYTCYVKYGLDTLHLALHRKSQAEKATHNDSDFTKERLPSQGNTSAIKWLTEDVAKCGVKRLDIGFMKESSEGDDLFVHVWQEEDERFIVKCSIEAEDKSVLSQFVVEYFTPTTHL